MNEFVQRVKPINGNHSIKEATISLFLVNPIIKPERFQKLLSSHFKDRFKQFNILESVKVQLQNREGASSVSANTIKNSGFRFTDYNTLGRPNRVFQGQNDDARTVISFHSLEYIRWNDFYNGFKEIIELFSQEAKEQFVKSFSLQYIDIFNWEGDILHFNTELFFNTNSNVLPQKFFHSSFNRTFLLTIEQEFENIIFFDRIELKTEKKMVPEITIRHNVAHQLQTEMDLETLINDEFFSKMLNVAHRRNKDILGDILSNDIKQLINL